MKKYMPPIDDRNYSVVVEGAPGMRRGNLLRSEAMKEAKAMRTRLRGHWKTKVRVTFRGEEIEEE